MSDESKAKTVVRNTLRKLAPYAGKVGAIEVHAIESSFLENNAHFLAEQVIDSLAAAGYEIRRREREPQQEEK